jgi:hypothetical protein
LPGMILAAPIVSAAVRVHDDLISLRTAAAAGDGQQQPPSADTAASAGQQTSSRASI